jgi:hypothetical protein
MAMAMAMAMAIRWDLEVGIVDLLVLAQPLASSLRGTLPPHLVVILQSCYSYIL